MLISQAYKSLLCGFPNVSRKRRTCREIGGYLRTSAHRDTQSHEGKRLKSQMRAEPGRRSKSVPSKLSVSGCRMDVQREPSFLVGLINQWPVDGNVRYRYSNIVTENAPQCFSQIYLSGTVPHSWCSSLYESYCGASRLDVGRTSVRRTLDLPVRVEG